MDNKRLPKHVTYKIADTWEETYCHSCGCPLFVGDVAYMSTETEQVYCSKKCLSHEQPKQVNSEG